jgi:hypothetical protein
MVAEKLYMVACGWDLMEEVCFSKRGKTLDFFLEHNNPWTWKEAYRTYTSQQHNVCPPKPAYAPDCIVPRSRQRLMAPLKQSATYLISAHKINVVEMWRVQENHSVNVSESLRFFCAKRVQKLRGNCSIPLTSTTVLTAVFLLEPCMLPTEIQGCFTQ